MGLKNTHQSYGSIAKWFHWLMLALILAMLVVGFSMTDMDSSPAKFAVYGWHKSVGALLLFLVLARLWWRIRNPEPVLPDTLDAWQKNAAKATHWILYALMLAMPLSGWAMSSAAGFPVSVFGWFTLPNIAPADKVLLQFFRQAHGIMALLVIILVLLHATAALLHHFYYRDDVLRRMLPAWRKRP